MEEKIRIYIKHIIKFYIFLNIEKTYMENESEEESKSKKDNNLSSQANTIINSFNSNITNDNVEKIMIEKISILLSDICDENAKLYKTENNQYIKPFLSKNIPQISINDYIERLYKYNKINTSTIILILIYIDRICNINKFKLTYFNIHKLILASMIIAIKYNEDEYYSTQFYAKLGGVSIAEINSLEYYFLKLIKYNLFVTEDLFNKYNDYISSSESDEDIDYDSDNI